MSALSSQETDATRVDWVETWRAVVRRAHRPGRPAGEDFWAGRAEEFHERTRRDRPDELQNFVLGAIAPGCSIADIGAGTGAWAIPLASVADRVTAVENSPSMVAVLRHNLAGAAVTNVDVVPGTWPSIAIGEHDYTLAAHSIYGEPDLPRFVEAMVTITRRACFLVVRAPVRGGVLAEAAEHLWGSHWDSPNFPIAYNALLQLGLVPNVLVERTMPSARTSRTLDDALDRIKRRLGLSDSADHDPYLLALLERRLTRQDGRFVWPREFRSALVYWEVS